MASRLSLLSYPSLQDGTTETVSGLGFIIEKGNSIVMDQIWCFNRWTLDLQITFRHLITLFDSDVTSSRYVHTNYETRRVGNPTGTAGKTGTQDLGSEGRAGTI